jgi:hypothetical protein
MIHNEPTSNRYKVMFINNKTMLMLITGECIIKNIPENTKLCEAQWDFLRRGWNIIIENPSFPEVDPAIIADFYELEIEQTGKRLGRRLYFG